MTVENLSRDQSTTALRGPRTLEILGIDDREGASDGDSRRLRGKNFQKHTAAKQLEKAGPSVRTDSRIVRGVDGQN